MSVDQWIKEASEEFGVPENIVRGVINQESGGRHYDDNGEVLGSSAGARGIMQLLPETAEALGVNWQDPKDNIRGGVKYLKQNLDKYNGNVSLALAAYNAGSGAVDEYGGIPPYEETQNYVKSIMSALEQQGGNLFARNFNPSQDPQRDAKETQQAPPVSEASQVVQAKDKFLDAFFDSALGGGLRSLYLDSAFSSGNKPDGSPQPITQQDVDYVNKMFPGDFVTQKFLLMNANNEQHLAALAQTKKEDLERQQRVSQYGYGISTLATLAGNIVSDPTVFLPVVGEEALVVKGMARMGKLASVVPMAKWAKYGKIAATQGALNVADRAGAEHWGGYANQDYTSAFILGGALGGGMAAGVDLFKHYHDPATMKIRAATQNAQDHIAAQTTGARMPNEVPLTRPEVERMHDASFASEFKSDNLKTLMDGKKVYAVTRDGMETLANKLGIEFNPNAKAFYNEAEGYAAIVKDNLKPGDNIDDLLLHEIGVHGGMKDFVGEKTWNNILDTVSNNIKNPQGPWKEAVRRSPGGGPEEILAHYIELAGNKDNKFLNRMRGTINAKLRDFGVSRKLSNSELIDFAHRSLQREVEKVKGFHELPDGSVVAGGFKYSAGNATNPNIVADLVETEKEVLQRTQGGTGVMAKVGQWFENGFFSGTLGGILNNSKVKSVSRLANSLMHDARMGEYKGAGPMPLEMQKQEMMQQLSTHWHAYVTARDKYIAENMKGSRFGMNADDMRLTANKNVVDYLNMKYGGHKGSSELDFDEGTKQMAEAYKNLYDAMLEIGKTSSERFGYAHRNMVDKDFKARTGEIFRVIDPEQRYNAINNQFGSYEKFSGFMHEYLKEAADRPAIREELLENMQKDWEVEKAKHDVVVEKARKAAEKYNGKELPAWQAKVDKVNAAYEEKVAKATKEWEDRVETIKEKDLERQIIAEDRWKEKVEDQKLRDDVRWLQIQEDYQKALDEWKAVVKELPKGERVPKKPQRPKRPSPPLKAQKPTVPASPLPPKPKMPKPKLPEKPKAPVEPPESRPRPTEVTPEQLEEHIDEWAGKAAYGMADQDISNIHHFGGSDDLSFFRQRFPMDTSHVKLTEKGLPFSYDANLRSYDLDAITNGIANRLTGEAAFRNYFPNPNDYDKWLKEVEQVHYGKGIDQNLITEEQKAKELKALDYAISSLRGMRPDGDVATRAQAMSGLFRKFAYSQNGANMGWNQAGESGGAIGYAGLKAVLHIAPAVDDFVRSMTKGADHTAALHEVTRHVFGQNVAKEVWKTNWASRVWHEVAGANSMLKNLDKVESAANYMGKVTTSVNFMQRLTDWMVTGSRAESIADSVEWAGGKEFSKLRNPFSAKKLAAAGVNQEMADVIKANIKKYTSFNEKGYMNHMDVAAWQKEDPTSYAKWRFLLDNQSMRTIQQTTIGNTAYLTSAHEYSTFMKVLFQFKDFSLKAVNGSTMRALTHREMDDAVSMLGSMATNAMVYAGLTYGKSYMYYPDDAKKRTEYMEKMYGKHGERLAAAAVLRGVMTGSILGFGGDVATGVFGTDTFRTTFDNTKKPKSKDRDASDVFGDTFGQNPSFRVAESAVKAAKVGAEALAPHQHVTRRELSDAVKAFPLQNALPMMWLTTELSKPLPEKERKGDYWFKH